MALHKEADIPAPTSGGASSSGAQSKRSSAAIPKKYETVQQKQYTLNTFDPTAHGVQTNLPGVAEGNVKLLRDTTNGTASGLYYATQDANGDVRMNILPAEVQRNWVTGIKNNTARQINDIRNGIGLNDSWKVNPAANKYHKIPDPRVDANANVFTYEQYWADRELELERYLATLPENQRDAKRTEFANNPSISRAAYEKQFNDARAAGKAAIDKRENKPTFGGIAKNIGKNMARGLVYAIPFYGQYRAVKDTINHIKNPESESNIAYQTARWISDKMVGGQDYVSDEGLREYAAKGFDTSTAAGRNFQKAHALGANGTLNLNNGRVAQDLAYKDMVQRQTEATAHTMIYAPADLALYGLPSLAAGWTGLDPLRLANEGKSRKQIATERNAAIKRWLAVSRGLGHLSSEEQDELLAGDINQYTRSVNTLDSLLQSAPAFLSPAWRAGWGMATGQRGAAQATTAYVRGGWRDVVANAKSAYNIIRHPVESAKAARTWLAANANMAGVKTLGKEVGGYLLNGKNWQGIALDERFNDITSQANIQHGMMPFIQAASMFSPLGAGSEVFLGGLGTKIFGNNSFGKVVGQALVRGGIDFAYRNNPLASDPTLALKKSWHFTDALVPDEFNQLVGGVLGGVSQLTPGVMALAQRNGSEAALNAAALYGQSVAGLNKVYGAITNPYGYRTAIPETAQTYDFIHGRWTPGDQEQMLSTMMRNAKSSNVHDNFSWYWKESGREQIKQTLDQLGGISRAERDSLLEHLDAMSPDERVQFLRNNKDENLRNLLPSIESQALHATYTDIVDSGFMPTAKNFTPSDSAALLSGLEDSQYAALSNMALNPFETLSRIPGALFGDGSFAANMAEGTFDSRISDLQDDGQERVGYLLDHFENVLTNADTLAAQGRLPIQAIATTLPSALKYANKEQKAKIEAALTNLSPKAKSALADSVLASVYQASSGDTGGSDTAAQVAMSQGQKFLSDPTLRAFTVDTINSAVQDPNKAVGVMQIVSEQLSKGNKKQNPVTARKAQELLQEVTSTINPDSAYQLAQNMSSPEYYMALLQFMHQVSSENYGPNSMHINNADQIKEAFTSGAKDLVTSKIKQDPATWLPIAAGLYTASKGWTGVGTTLADPTMFYGMLGLALTGGLGLGALALGGN